MDPNWIFNININYPKENYSYWFFKLNYKNWNVKLEKWTNLEYASDPVRYRSENLTDTKFTLETKRVYAINEWLSGDNPKQLEIEIHIVELGNWYGATPCDISKFWVVCDVKLSDAIIKNWHYYINNHPLGDSFYEDKSFETDITFDKKGEWYVFTK